MVQDRLLPGRSFLFQASATMADKFSCSCTGLGPGLQLDSYFLQTGTSEILSASEPDRVMSWVQMALGKNLAATQLYFFTNYHKQGGGRRTFFTTDQSMEPIIFKASLPATSLAIKTFFFSSLNPSV